MSTSEQVGKAETHCHHEAYPLAQHHAIKGETPTPSFSLKSRGFGPNLKHPSFTAAIQGMSSQISEL